MFAVFPCSRLFALCRKRLPVVICAVFGCFLCRSVTAAPGDVDANYGIKGVASVTYPDGNIYVTQLLPIPTGETLVIARCTQGTYPYEHSPQGCIYKLANDGKLVQSFGTNGFGTYASPADASYFIEITTATAQTDGKLLVVGGCKVAKCIFRLTEDGAIDREFGNSGFYYFEAACGGLDLALQSTGGIIVLTECSSARLGLRRVTATGLIDTAYGNNGTSTGPVGVHWSTSKLAVDATDAVYVGGICADWFDILTKKPCLWKTNSAGLTDMTFGTNGFSSRQIGRVYDGVYSNVLVVDASHRAIFATTCIPGSYSFCATRFLPNGNADLSFGAQGVLSHDITSGQDEATTGAMTTDGKFFLAGTCGNGWGLQLSGSVFPVRRPGCKLQPD